LQITFFRSRTPYGRDNPSRFAPQQLLLAHAALAIPDRGKLLHDQQSWRAGEVVAQYKSTDTDIAIGLPSSRWSMVRSDSDQYLISINAEAFQFTITATPPLANPTPVLQGEKGYSKKGPTPNHASYYYSRPQLRVEGEYQTTDTKIPVSGTGWLRAMRCIQQPATSVLMGNCMRTMNCLALKHCDFGNHREQMLATQSLHD